MLFLYHEVIWTVLPSLHIITQNKMSNVMYLGVKSRETT